MCPMGAMWQTNCKIWIEVIIDIYTYITETKNFKLHFKTDMKIVLLFNI